MDTTLRWILPLYFVLYIAVAFIWRSYVAWKQTGINPYRLGSSDSPHDYAGRLFRLTIGVDAAVILLYAIWPDAFAYLTPIRWLISPAAMAVGLALLVGSLVWTVIAQVQMGSAWRIGIDEQHQTPLIQHGLFRYSRNPIFLGMRLTMLGLFLVLPNAVTLATLALGEALTQIQVRLEEEFLARAHGEQYADYRRRTARWLGWTGG